LARRHQSGVRSTPRPADRSPRQPPSLATCEATWTQIAERVLRSPPSDGTRGALFFHNIAIDTPWVRERQRTVQIGQHIFYR
jgi:hypothetical protein